MNRIGQELRYRLWIDRGRDSPSLVTIVRTILVDIAASMPTVGWWFRWVGVIVLFVVIMVILLAAVRFSQGNNPFPPIVPISQYGITEFYIVDLGTQTIKRVGQAWGSITSVCQQDPTRVLLYDFVKVQIGVNEWRLKDGEASPRIKGDNVPVKTFADYSSDCRQILFIGEVNRVAHFYRMDGDGTHMEVLTDDSQDVGNLGRFSPDALRIAYVVHLKDGFGIRVMELAAKKQQTVFLPVWSVDDLQWSPDGTKLAIVYENRGGKLELAVYSTIDLRVLWNVVCSYAPVWSPDGTQLAYATGCYDGEIEGAIAVIDAVGKKSRQLLKLHDRSEAYIQWITGDALVFLTHLTSWTHGVPYNWQIHTIRTDGSGFTTVGFLP